MSKEKSEKLFYGIGVVIVVVLIVGAIFLLVQGMKGTLEGGEAPPAPEVAEENKFAECAKERNVSSDSIIFYYSDDCDDCTEMVSVARKVEGEGYKIYWAKNTEFQPRFLVMTCYLEVASGVLPEFFCAGTGETKSGKISEGELKAFAQACAQNAG